MASGQTHADNVLNQFRGTTNQYTSVYISLHTGDPAATGANEMTWSKYARQRVESARWGAPTGTAGSNRRTQCVSTLTFSTVGTTTEGQKAIYLGVWNHLTQTSATTNFLAGGALNTSVTLNSNVVPSFVANACDIEQD